VQLKTETDKIRGLKGLKEVAIVRAFVDGKEKKSAVGDLLFTEYGVSGNTIFQISSCFNGKGNESLKIEFLPDLSEEQLKLILSERKNKKYVSDTEILDGILVKRIAQVVLKTAKSSKIEDILYALKNFSLKVTGNLGFNYSQVTKGGIKTNDVNPLTMESRLEENFYIVGEALDIDGDCGGYNITFAFVSGILAGLAIKNK
jgi:predicted Rossmann fold flavoprotein